MHMPHEIWNQLAWCSVLKAAQLGTSISRLFLTNCNVVMCKMTSTSWIHTQVSKMWSVVSVLHPGSHWCLRAKGETMTHKRSCQKTMQWCVLQNKDSACDNKWCATRHSSDLQCIGLIAWNCDNWLAILATHSFWVTISRVPVREKETCHEAMPFWQGTGAWSETLQMSVLGWSLMVCAMILLRASEDLLLHKKGWDWAGLHNVMLSASKSQLSASRQGKICTWQDLELTSGIQSTTTNNKCLFVTIPNWLKCCTKTDCFVINPLTFDTGKAKIHVRHVHHWTKCQMGANWLLNHFEF